MWIQNKPKQIHRIIVLKFLVNLFMAKASANKRSHQPEHRPRLISLEVNKALIKWTDKSGQMPRLILVFADHTCQSMYWLQTTRLEEIVTYQFSYFSTESYFLGTVNVLKTLAACQKGLYKQCRHRSEYHQTASELIRVFPVCYPDKLFVNSRPDNQHFI